MLPDLEIVLVWTTRAGFQEVMHPLIVDLHITKLNADLSDIHMQLTTSAWIGYASVEHMQRGIW